MTRTAVTRLTLAALVACLLAAVTPTVASGADATLTTNRIYRAKAMRDVGCPAESTVPLDSVADVEAFYASVLPCLNRAWKKEFTRAGMRFKPAKLVIHSGERVSRCGAQVISFYCPSERTIYMYAPEIINPWRQYPTDYSHGLTRLAAAHTIAHEYGHHVQQLSGIFGAIRSYRGQAERRAELQASCLGNVFLAAQASAYPISADYASMPQYWRYITVANHGSVASQQYWTERGFAKVRPGACNTFAVSPGKVR